MKRDFIAITDFSTSELQAMLDLAVDLKKEWKSGGKNNKEDKKTMRDEYDFSKTKFAHKG